MLASVRNLTIKDAHTLSSVREVSLATCEREKKSSFQQKMGLDRTLWSDRIGKNHDRHRWDYLGPRGPSGFSQMFNNNHSYKLVYIQKEPRAHSGLDRT
jgi:hypothetical protein